MTFGPGYEKWTERQFQRVITHELGPYFGWTRHYHNLYAVGSDSGFPDLVMVKPGVRNGMLFLEVKGPKGKISNEQRDWVDDIRSTGCHAHIVFPEDLPLLQGLLKMDFDPPEPANFDIDPRLLALREFRGLEEQV
jgi:hypothetical protein